MAKIISSKEIDKSAVFFTLTFPQKGEKILFLDTNTIDGIATTFVTDEGKKYANGIKCLIADEFGLRPYILPWQSIVAKGETPVEGSVFPQLKHTLTLQIARGGCATLEELGSKKAVGKFTEIYNLTVKKRNKDEVFSWGALGMENTEETYQETEGKFVFGKSEISKTEVLEFFKKRMEAQNERLGNTTPKQE